MPVSMNVSSMCFIWSIRYSVVTLVVDGGEKVWRFGVQEKAHPFGVCQTAATRRQAAILKVRCHVVSDVIVLAMFVSQNSQAPCSVSALRVASNLSVLIGCGHPLAVWAARIEWTQTPVKPCPCSQLF